MRIIIVTILAVFFFCISYAQDEKYGKIPNRILLNVTMRPESSIAVSWQTIESINQPVVEIAMASPWTEFEKKSRMIKSKTEKKSNTWLVQGFHYSAIIDSLAPNTLYAYRVGGDSIWSEWNQFKTAKNEFSPFTFTYFGDIQHDVKKFGSRVLRNAFSMSPNSSFWLFTGDIVDKAELDYQWNEFFTAASFITSIIPSVLVAGNHEYADTLINGKKEEILIELWRSHILQPEIAIKGIEETVFYFDYQGVRFIVLNGNEKLEEQSKWLENVLNNNSNTWTIIAIHQPIYSMSKGRDQRKTKNAFLPLFDKYNVDLVLQGHDHVYARTFKLKNDAILADNEKGTVYVTSNSGSDEYKLNSLNSGLTVKWDNKDQLFQVITVDKNLLQFKTYTVTGFLYDFFELKK